MGYFYMLIGHVVLCSSSIARQHGTSRAAAQDSAAFGRSSSSGSSSGTRLNGKAGAQSSSPNKQVWDSRDADDEGGDDDIGRKRPNRNFDNIAPKKLACPYFKRDLVKYQDWRSCPGPGWGTTHRLK